MNIYYVLYYFGNYQIIDNIFMQCSLLQINQNRTKEKKPKEKKPKEKKPKENIIIYKRNVSHTFL